MAKILGEKHLHLHHCHEKIKSIEPTWLTHSLLVLVWVWPHSLAVTCIICDSDACCSSRSQDPALISGYSHPKPQHTKSKINKALNTDTQLFFSLQFSYFHFCTSVSVVQCFTLARSIALLFHWPVAVGWGQHCTGGWDPLSQCCPHHMPASEGLVHPSSSMHFG